MTGGYRFLSFYAFATVIDSVLCLSSAKQSAKKVKAKKIVDAEFFRKPTFQEALQSNSVDGYDGNLAEARPKGPTDAEWYYLTPFPDKGVTMDVDTPALAGRFDVYDVELFNETDSNYTVFGFPEAELHTELFKNDDSSNFIPFKPHIIVDDPAVFAAAQEVAEANASEETTIGEIENVDANATSANIIDDIIDNVVGNTSTNTTEAVAEEDGTEAVTAATDADTTAEPTNATETVAVNNTTTADGTATVDNTTTATVAAEDSSTTEETNATDSGVTASAVEAPATVPAAAVAPVVASSVAPVVASSAGPVVGAPVSGNAMLGQSVGQFGNAFGSAIGNFANEAEDEIVDAANQSLSFLAAKRFITKRKM